MGRLNVMLIGGGFKNKGAESMVFSAVSEIGRLVPGAKFYFAAQKLYDINTYKMIPVYDRNLNILDWTIRGRFFDSLKILCYRTMDCIRSRSIIPFRMKSLKSAMKQIDLILDLSGFALGDKWKTDDNLYYLEHIKLARCYKKPIYLMPQSFGGFDYKKDKELIYKVINENINYPRIIFAREKEGKELLDGLFHTKNTVLACDMVLQTESVDTDLIFKGKKKREDLDIKKHSVCIIPSVKATEHGNSSKIKEMYKQIIDKLSLDHNVYLT